MKPVIDATHDPQRRSWVDSANSPETDFPIQNLPFGRFREAADMDWRIGVAIGDQVLDLRKAGLVHHADMNRLMRLKPETRRELRLAISDGLQAGSAQQAAWRQPLLPNYQWVPIGYHGRASTVLPSGHAFPRPWGQLKGPNDAQPRLAPTQRLDLELEVGIFIGRPNAIGQPIPIDAAEEHVFGLTLFNDWSARDVQAWEYQPLGPFLSKNFASTTSPWIVTLEALAPFRRPFVRAAGEPQPLPYLDSADNRAHGAFDIGLEVWLQTAAMRAAGQPGECLSRSNFADAAYWTVAQLVAHHTVNGCSLSHGDLFGSGTLSGPRPEQAGSLLELTEGGKRAISLANGEQRTFLQDGDAITLRGHCARDGFRRIGFGDCSATVLPAVTTG